MEYVSVTKLAAIVGDLAAQKNITVTENLSLWEQTISIAVHVF